jgi:hypothetical protein
MAPLELVLPELLDEPPELPLVPDELLEEPLELPLVPDELLDDPLELLLAEPLDDPLEDDVASLPLPASTTDDEVVPPQPPAKARAPREAATHASMTLSARTTPRRCRSGRQEKGGIVQTSVASAAGRASGT